MGFDHPAGAAADLKELEYICALHQSATESVRVDGSIFAQDVVFFLMSRYGIQVTTEFVQSTILKGLGGGDEEEECIDITEVMSILTIPFLTRTAREKAPNDEEEREGSLNESIDEPMDEPMDEEAAEMGQAPSNDPQPLGGTALSHTNYTRQDFKTNWDYNRYIWKRTCARKLLLKDSSKIVRHVLDTILLEATGTKTRPPITEDLVRDLLYTYGEEELASDQNLLREMVAEATCATMDEKSEEPMREAPNQEVPKLDVKTFLQALTNDVRLYDTDKAVEWTTNYEDVFGKYCVQDSKKGFRETVLEELSPGETRTDEDFKKERTASYVDYTADTYKSKFMVVLLFVLFVSFYCAYLYSLQIFPRKCNDEGDKLDFLCYIRNSTVRWILVGVNLSVSGIVIIGFGSLGNGEYSQATIPMVLGMIVIGCAVGISFFTEWEIGPVSFVKKDSWIYHALYVIVLILGCTVLTLQVFQIIRSLFPRQFFEEHERVAHLATQPNVYAEAQIKRAAINKLNGVFKNAYDIHIGAEHDKQTSREGRRRSTMLYFAQHGQTKESLSSKTVWMDILSGELFTKRGVWLSSRLIASNVAQVIAVLILLAISINFALQDVDHRTLQCVVDACKLSLCPLSCKISSHKEMMACMSTCECYYDCPPQIPRHVFVASCSVGIAAALIKAFRLIAVYIPSYVGTVIQFRSGLIPSLQDPTFVSYRFDLDNVAMILGSMFWGLLFSSVLIGVICGGIVFLSLWPETQKTMILVYAQILGILVAIILKVLLLQLMRRRYFSAFYRRKPAVTNITSLGLECWNLGLASGFMAVRGISLLFAAISHMGRIDRPLITSEAGMGSLATDAYPMIFRQDILAHDAHRHPYLEILGVMYLMKMRYANKFGRTSGSVWRLLFVFALMPWIKRHRLLVRPSLDSPDDDDKEKEKQNEDQVALLAKKVLADADEMRQKNDELEAELERTKKETEIRVAELEAKLARQEKALKEADADLLLGNESF